MASNPWDYYERLRNRERAKTDDPVAAAVAGIKVERVKRTIMEARESASEAARVTRVSRETGETPATVSSNIGEYEKAIGAQRLADVAARYSIVSDWFTKNPRSVVVAQGDHKSIGVLGRTLEFLGEIPDALQAGTTRAAGALNDFYQSIDEALLPFTNPSGGRAQLDQYDLNRASYSRRYEVQRPRSDSFVVSSALAGVESIPASLAGIAVGSVTRSPGAAATVMGITTGAPAYREALSAGKSTATSLRYGVEQGLIEGLTEKVPAGKWLEALTKRTPAGKAILSSLAEEIPGEQLATILQDFSTWATLTPDRPFSEYLAERPQAALQTAIATITGTAAQVGTTQLAVKTGGALVSRAQSARRARSEREVLAGFERAAVESSYKASDPVGYAEMVGHLARQMGVEAAFIAADCPGEYLPLGPLDEYL